MAAAGSSTRAAWWCMASAADWSPARMAAGSASSTAGEDRAGIPWPADNA